jgi:hypothetical protein
LEELTFRFELRSNTGRARPNQVSSSLIRTTAYIEEKVKRFAEALDYKKSDMSSFTSGQTIDKLFTQYQEVWSKEKARYLIC